jgi:hypothetical protein
VRSEIELTIFGAGAGEGSGVEIAGGAEDVSEGWIGGDGVGVGVGFAAGTGCGVD